MPLYYTYSASQRVSAAFIEENAFDRWREALPVAHGWGVAGYAIVRDLSSCNCRMVERAERFGYTVIYCDDYILIG